MTSLRVGEGKEGEKEGGHVQTGTTQPERGEKALKRMLFPREKNLFLQTSAFFLLLLLLLELFTLAQ